MARLKGWRMALLAIVLALLASCGGETSLPAPPSEQPTLSRRASAATDEPLAAVPGSPTSAPPAPATSVPATAEPPSPTSAPPAPATPVLATAAPPSAEPAAPPPTPPAQTRTDVSRRWIAFTAGDFEGVLAHSLYIMADDGGQLRGYELALEGFQWAPRDTRLAYVTHPPNGDARPEHMTIYVIDPERGGEAVFVDQGHGIVWSPDGTWLSYIKQGQVMLAAQGQRPRAVPAASGAQRLAWLPDGQRFVYTTDAGLFLSDSGGAAPLRLAEVADIRELWVSPDGAWIAVLSGERGSLEGASLYAVSSGEVRITVLLGSPLLAPVWSPDSQLLAFGEPARPGERDTPVRLVVSKPDGRQRRELFQTDTSWRRLEVQRPRLRWPRAGDALIMEADGQRVTATLDGRGSLKELVHEPTTWRSPDGACQLEVQPTEPVPVEGFGDIYRSDIFLLGEAAPPLRLTSQESGGWFSIDRIEWAPVLPAHATLAPGEPATRGCSVVDAQRHLRRLGYDPGPLDGIYGSQSQAAILRLQRDRGLLDDAVVGPATWAALRATS